MIRKNLSGKFLQVKADAVFLALNHQPNEISIAQTGRA
jgi:hypothetical protein